MKTLEEWVGSGGRHNDRTAHGCMGHRDRTTTTLTGTER